MTAKYFYPEYESDLSREEIVFVARMPGNANIESLISTVNRIDTYDTAKFSKSYGKRRGQDGYDPTCDFDGDFIVGPKDLSMLNYNYGKVQPNSLGNTLVGTTILHY